MILKLEINLFLQLLCTSRPTYVKLSCGEMFVKKQVLEFVLESQLSIPFNEGTP